MQKSRAFLKAFGVFLLILGITGFLLYDLKKVLSTPPATPETNLVVTNDGVVNSIIAASDGSYYIGGTFTKIGTSIGTGVAVDTSSGATFSQPAVNGLVNVAAPDGSGGWYIGGSFTQIGATTRNRLAHILADGTLDPIWNPDVSNTVNDIVNAIVVDGSTIYIAGSFAKIGGVTRNNLAAIDPAGALLPWNPNVTGTWINAMSIGNGIIYFGGWFTSVGGNPRTNLGAVAADGTVQSWAPTATTNSVKAIAVSGGTIYIAGSFTTINSTTRYRIAALDTSGVLTSWAPSVTGGQVNDMTVSGGNVYIVGAFSSAGGSTRSKAAALNASTGAVTSWNPSIGTLSTHYLNQIEIYGSTAYLGGDFQSSGGQKRFRLAAVDATSGVVTAWNPAANGAVAALALNGDGTKLYVGGTFSLVGGNTQNYVAHILVDGSVDPNFNPNPNNKVTSLLLNGSTLYMGGSFTTINGTTRNRLASWDLANGTLSSWDPNAASTVSEMKIANGILYVGGSFSTMGGQSRWFGASFDVSTGALQAWDPRTNASINSIVPDGSTVYIGGNFTTSNGTARNRLAAVDATTGALQAWNPNASSTVWSMIKIGSTLYIGGSFTSIVGTARTRLAAVGTDGVLSTTWDPASASVVYTLATNGSLIYIGNGSYPNQSISKTGQTTKNVLAAMDTNAAFDAWAPFPNNAVYAIALSPLGDAVYVGGEFTAIGIQIHGGLAQFGSIPYVSVNDIAVTETDSGNDATATFTVTLNTASAQSVTVNYTMADLTATSPDDYTTGTGTLTFSPGETTKTIPVTVKGDNLNETATETFKVTLSGNTVAGILDNIGVATITDNDSPPQVQFSSSVGSAAESSPSQNIALSLSGASTQTVTVGYAVTGGTAGGSGADYTLAAGTTTFAIGTTTAVIPFAITDDNTDESDETLVVSLSNPTNATLGSTTAHVFTIMDDDPNVAFPTATGTGSEGSETLSIPVSLNAALPGPVTFNYTVSGTAISGTDYILNSGTTMIAVGSTTVQIPVLFMDDALAESDETLVVTLSNPDGAGLGTIATYTYTITDNDTSATGFTIGDTTVNEVNTGFDVAATFTVALSSGTSTPVSVNYATVAGTAAAGIDFTPSSGTLVFAPGETSKTVAVAVRGDLNYETMETFRVVLSNAGNVPLADWSGTANIIDNDSPPTVQFAQLRTVSPEASASPTVGVVLSAESYQNITVNYAVTEGNAVSGTHYTLLPSPLVIPAGTTSKNIPVTVVDNTTTESVPTRLVFTLSNPINAALGANTGSELLIVDNDASGSTASQYQLTGSYQVVINDGAAITDSPQVKLKFNVPSGTTKMLISQFPDFSRAAEENFTSERDWSFCTPMSAFDVHSLQTDVLQAAASVKKKPAPATKMPARPTHVPAKPKPVIPSPTVRTQPRPTVLPPAPLVAPVLPPVSLVNPIPVANPFLPATPLPSNFASPLTPTPAFPGTEVQNPSTRNYSNCPEGYYNIYARFSNGYNISPDTIAGITYKKPLPAPPPPVMMPLTPLGITVNDGDSVTGYPVVKLKFFAGSGAKKILLSRFPDFQDPIEADFVAEKEWLVCSPSGSQGPVTECPAGSYAVYGKYMNEDGRISETAFALLEYKPVSIPVSVPVDELAAANEPTPEEELKIENKTVLINNDASATNEAKVQLNLNAPEGAKYMVISRTASFLGGRVQPFQKAQDWNICNGLAAKNCTDGTYMVYVRFFNAAKKSLGTWSDSIAYQMKEEYPVSLPLPLQQPLEIPQDTADINSSIFETDETDPSAQNLYDLGIIGEERNFDLKTNVPKAHAVEILVKIVKGDLGDSANYLREGYKLGITNDVRPSKNKKLVTRVEFMAMALKALKISTAGSSKLYSQVPFKDFNKRQSWAPVIAKAWQMGFLQADEDGTVGASKTFDHYEMDQFITRIQTYLENE